MPKPTMREWQDIRYGSTMPDVGLEDYRKGHETNTKRCRDAISYWKEKDRLLEVLALFGSGRSTENCSGEISNSTMLLEKGLEEVSEETGINIERVHLNEYTIEPCNNCLATCSALCGFPCNCFPYAQEGAQRLYPKILRADVLLMSTGVYQSSMATRLKALLDRCICLDGGYYVSPEQYAFKNQEWRQKMIRISTEEEVKYDPRLFGKVCAYFISSKDQNNEEKGAHNMEISYIEMVARQLFDGNDDFMMFHPDPYYVGFAAKPNEDYSYDKLRLSKDAELHKKAKSLVRAAVKLAQDFRKNGYPELKDTRKNRT